MSFPTVLDDLSTTRASQGTDKLSSPDHLTHHVAEDTATQALETKVGVDGSAVATTLDYLLKNASSSNPGHIHTWGNILKTVSSLADLTTKTHSLLSSLTADDHTQYPLLAGRSGGQILIGGSAITDILKLQGTSGNGTSTSPAIQLMVGNAGATVALTVLNNGNIGIATLSPEKMLDVNGEVRGTKIFNASGELTGTTYSSQWSTYGNYIANANSSNVGIGTTSPSDAKLQVVLTNDTYETVPLVLQNHAGGGGTAVRMILACTSNVAANTNGRADFLVTRQGADDSADLNILLSPGNLDSPTSKLYIAGASGAIGIGTVSPTISGTGKLDMNADTFRLRTARTPANAGDTGNAGEICWDSGYIYVCVANNSWKRAAIGAW